ncbi:helix-turn-helix domain-containing protein [Glaciibacter superstes]|uniref:helix-turn-helix domain-containing protein n=1 Tax=Glaciibacter superstes TaxID=501023 RepID=UPI001FE190A5|nr:AraC family transcriptional regulator [Glaciibacter superstes]
MRSGSATLCSEVGQHRIVAGDVVLLASNTLCGSEPRDTITVTTLYLDRDYLTDQVFWQLSAILRDRHEAGLLIDAVYADPLQVIHLGEDSAGKFAPWLDELVALSSDRGQQSRFYRMQALLFAVLDVIVPHISVSVTRRPAVQRRATAPGTPRQRRFLPLRREAHHVANLIREAPERDWTLNELAETVYLSASQLGRVFAEAYGKSPIAYLTMARVERMAALLHDSDDSIALVARQVGWADADHAARQFRRSVGVPPSEYRHSVRRASQSERSV